MRSFLFPFLSFKFSLCIQWEGEAQITFILWAIVTACKGKWKWRVCLHWRKWDCQFCFKTKVTGTQSSAGYERCLKKAQGSEVFFLSLDDWGNLGCAWYCGAGYFWREPRPVVASPRERCPTAIAGYWTGGIDNWWGDGIIPLSAGHRRKKGWSWGQWDTKPAEPHCRCPELN